MKTFFAVIGFIGVSIIVVGLLIVAAGSAHHQPSLNEASSSSESSSSRSDSGFKRVTVNNFSYPQTTVSNVTVTIAKAGEGRGFANGYEIVRPEGGKFVEVRVLISNQQRDEITMSTSLFKLLTPDGVEYSASEKSLEISGEEALFLKNINPGLTKGGIVLFEVPSDLDVRSLRLSFRGGMTGETATLPLSEVGVALESPKPVQETVQTVEEPSTTPVASSEPTEQPASEPQHAAPIVRQAPTVAASQ
jgi:hypothetical protein